MAIIKYVRSIASISWIDPVTGLPEVDKGTPAFLINRNTITAKSGYRFSHLLEAWVNYDDQAKTIVGHGFTPASGIYRALSYGDIPSEEYQTLSDVKIGREPIVFTQIVGARTRSPEVLGGVWGFGIPGNIVGHIVSGFPPIWSKLQLSIYNDGRFEGKILRHSIFPSVDFYENKLDTNGATTVNYIRAFSYSGNDHLDRWKRQGWGKLRGNLSGPTAGNPWEASDDIFQGIDPGSPFGWL